MSESLHHRIEQVAESVLAVCGRLVGPMFIAGAGHQLCTSGKDWCIFAVGLLGAAFTTMRTVTPRRLEIAHRHTVGGTIDVEPLRVEMPNQEEIARALPQAIPVPETIPPPPSSMITPEDLVAEAKTAHMKMQDLALALKDLGFDRATAKELSKELVFKMPKSSLEELVRAAIDERKRVRA